MPSRAKRPVLSPLEQALDRATTRASNEYALIHKAMCMTMKALKGKSFGMAVQQADHAVTYTRALYRDMIEVSNLVKRMVAGPESPPPPFPPEGGVV